MDAIGRLRASAPAEKNVGGLERVARLGLGVALLVLAVGVVGYGSGAVGNPTLRVILAGVALLVGARLLWTALTQKCRLNRRVGRNSYRD